MPHNPLAVVIDWDVTVRLLRPHEYQFVARYARLLTAQIIRHCQVTQKDVRWTLDQGQKAIIPLHHATPQKGWTDNEGRVLVPPSDVLIRIRPVANELLDNLGLFQNPPERGAMLDAIYKEAYGAMGVTFRQGARDFFLGLHELGIPITVVSNTETRHIQDQIKQLGTNSAGGNDLDFIEVVGGARKFIVKPHAPGDPSATLQIPGIPYDVETDRPHYAQVLENIAARHEVDFTGLVVVGDMFQMDLALPWRQGAHILMMTCQGITPRAEINFCNAERRAYAIYDLLRALRVISYLHESRR